MARFAVFRIVLQEPASGITTVDYHTVPGTAVEGEDYTPATGTLSFNAGEVEKEVRVSIRSVEEVTDESFTLVLSNPVGLVLGRTPATGTIPAGSTPPTELEGIYTNRVLQVLFMPGEQHEGESGGPSDTEWAVAPEDGIIEGSGDPYPGVMGQFRYDVGVILLGGQGAITTLSGWKFHYLAADYTGGTKLVQPVFTNRDTMAGDQSLDPATAAEFDAWWDAKGRTKMQLLTAAGGVVMEGVMPRPTTDPDLPGTPGTMKVGALTPVVWPATAKDTIARMRLVPDVDGVSEVQWSVTMPVAVLDGTSTPRPLYAGHFRMIVAGETLLGGTGPIPIDGGWWLHAAMVGGQGGAQNTLVQLIVTNRETIDNDQALDAGTADALDAWWNAKGPMRASLLDADLWNFAESPFILNANGGMKAAIIDPNIPMDQASFISKIQFSQAIPPA